MAYERKRYWDEVTSRAEDHPVAADCALLVMVWGLARFDGGAVAARGAEIITGGVLASCVWRWARRHLPRWRADEAYVRRLARWSFSPDRRAQMAGEPGSSAAALPRIAISLAFAAPLAVLSFLPSAPPTGALPLLRGAWVIASASGESLIVADIDDRYRYMVIGAPAGLTSEQFLAAEARFLRHAGWNHEQSSVFIGNSALPKSVPVTTPGADVELDSPDGGVYSAMSTIANPDDAAQDTSGTPLDGGAAINEALADHRPTLFIVLGNGRHT